MAPRELASSPTPFKNFDIKFLAYPFLFGILLTLFFFANWHLACSFHFYDIQRWRFHISFTHSLIPFSFLLFFLSFQTLPIFRSFTFSWWCIYGVYDYIEANWVSFVIILATYLPIVALQPL